MEVEITETTRHAQNLQTFVDGQHRKILECRSRNASEIYHTTARGLCNEFNGDISKVIDYIRVKLNWSLSHRILLLQQVQNDASVNKDKLDDIANFVFDPKLNIKKVRRFGTFIPSIATVERQYGSGVSAIFHLQTAFFLVNIFTLAVWLALIVIPYSILKSPSITFNSTFSFTTIFTTKGYLSESIFFQGSYPNGIITEKYNLSLMYFLTMYIYFFIWFIFLTVRFSTTYKRKLFNSILNTNLGMGFISAFARYDYTTKSVENKKKCMETLQRQFFDLIENDEKIDKAQLKKFETSQYKLKLVITNLFYILLSIGLGGINWIILSSCKSPTINCYGSIIYLVFINRLMPYFIVFMAQAEKYKYLSYKLNVIGFRCIFLNLCTTLSFTIKFFIKAPLCYETAYGQYVYILLLGDIFASLFLPIAFSLILDLIPNKENRNFDGINVHVQLSPPILLYSQFLIWIGIYFSPLLSIMILFNILFSFISHRLYIYMRSRYSDSHRRVFIWNGDRLEYLIYLLSCILLIISVTCFAIFTTVVKPSESCGPFRSLDAAYTVIEKFLNEYQNSVFWVSIINFITSPGFIYFLVATFITITYKLRHEELAEKQLVFIRDSNLTNKKKLREETVQNLYQKKKKNNEKKRKTLPTTSTTNENEIQLDKF